MSDDLVGDDAGMLDDADAGLIAAAGATLENGRPHGKLDGEALKNINCMNCGAPLTGPFCNNCGQKHDDIRRPFWTFMVQLFDDVLSYDSRTWRTMGYLMFVPGRLSRDYNQGRRARFLPPLRLYLVLTVLFFLSLELTSTALLDIELTRNDTRMAQLAERAEERGRKVLKRLAEEGALPQGIDYSKDWSASLNKKMALKQERKALERSAQQLRDAAARDNLPASTKAGLLKSAAEIERRIASLEADRMALEAAGVSEDARPAPVPMGRITEEVLEIEPPKLIVETPDADLDQSLYDVDDLIDDLDLDDIDFSDREDLAKLRGMMRQEGFSAEQKAALKKRLQDLGVGDDDAVSVRFGFGDDTAEAGEAGADDDECFSPIDDLPYCVNIRTFSPMAEERREGIREADLKLFEEEAGDEGRDYIIGFARLIQDPRGFNRLFNDQLPWAMLILLPIFALIVRLLHWGEGRYYMNQVVFALHFHAFLFAQLIVLVFVAPYITAEILFEAFWIATSIYLIIALKVGQKQSFIRAFLKAGLVWVPYSILMTAVVSGFVFWGLGEA